MCQDCIDKFKQLDPKVENTMDEIASDLEALVQRIADALPDSIIGMQMMGPDGKLYEKLEDVPEDDRKVVTDFVAKVKLNFAMSFIAGYMPFRWSDSREETMLYQMTLSQLVSHGANHGHTVAAGRDSGPKH